MGMNYTSSEVQEELHKQSNSFAKDVAANTQGLQYYSVLHLNVLPYSFVDFDKKVTHLQKEDSSQGAFFSAQRYFMRELNTAQENKVISDVSENLNYFMHY